MATTTKATELSQLSSALQVDESTGEIIFTGSLSVDSNTLFVDGDANRVGIGTLTPSSALDVSGDVTVSGSVDGRDVSSDGSKLDTIESGADVTDTGNVTSAGALMDSELTNESAIKNIDQELTTSSDVEFGGLDVDSGTLFVDSANGRVGVGTSSPDRDFTIVSDDTTPMEIITSSPNGYLKFNTSNTTDAVIVGASGDDLILRSDAGSHIFRKGPSSEAARIDSDGNLLVGTTDFQQHVATSGGGVSLINTGRVYAASTETGAGSPGNFNRISSDGRVIAIRKDGSVVGSIGVNSGNLTLNGSIEFDELPTVEGDPIVESGSNSDGDWVRFADGTQMVSDIITVNESDGDSFLVRNMAKSFIDDEYKVLNGQTEESIANGRLEASRSIMIRSGSSSQIEVRVLEPVLDPNYGIRQDYTAIGKWK